MSRAPVDDPTEEELSEDTTDTVCVGAIVAQSAQNVCPDLLVEELKTQARADPKYQSLVQAVTKRFTKSCLNEYTRLFLKLKDELSVHDGLVIRGCQIVIPPTQVRDVLKRLHESHQGIEKTKRRARQSVFWPGYTNDIKQVVQACDDCQKLRPSPVKEPLIQDTVPNRPFEMATSDLYQLGTKFYLIYADRYSGYPMLSEFSACPSASNLINEFRWCFSTMGVPNVLRSDQGRQYDSQQMSAFFEHWGVKWVPSSPHNSQSNGHAENTVKALKYLLKKCDGKVNSDEFQSGLLELKNSPREDGLSPAQRLFGHPLRSRVPTHWRAFDRKWQMSAELADKRRLETAEKQKFYYDRSSREAKPLEDGTRVLVKNAQSGKWDNFATTLHRHRRRYQLRFPSGRILWRNRKFLRSVPEQVSREETDSDSEQTVRRGARRRQQPNRLGF